MKTALTDMASPFLRIAKQAGPALLVGALALTLSACGNSGDDDPLTGTWSNTSCFGSATMPPDVEKCTTRLDFKSSLDIELRAEWFSLPATATNPRCTTTREVTGQQWSTNASAFTVTGSGSATIARSSCVNEADNLAATPTSDIAIPNGDTRYEISNDSLTILSGTLAGTYTR